jgi:hypothetical protein
MTYLRKYLIDPDRVRKIPASFSWVDRQFIREGYLQNLCQEAILLYFFLIIVGDNRGLSFYGDTNICKQLKLSAQGLQKGREQLITQGLIVYQCPMCQVLAIGLDREQQSSAGVKTDPVLVKNVLDFSFKEFSKKKGDMSNG